MGRKAIAGAAAVWGNLYGVFMALREKIEKCA